MTSQNIHAQLVILLELILRQSMLELSVSQHVCIHIHKCNNNYVSVINRANYSGPPTKLDKDNIFIGDSTCINGSVLINCSTYQSNLMYQWSKDGEVVTNPGPPNILNVTQRGNYTCTVANSASTENATSWIEGMVNAFCSINFMLLKVFDI